MSTSTTTTIRLSADERRMLDSAAEAAGLGPSSFARRAVMQALGRAAAVRRRPDGLAQALGRLLGEAGRIGNNLNQIARAANRGIPVPAETVEGCRQELARLTASLLALRRPHG